MNWIAPRVAGGHDCQNDSQVDMLSGAMHTLSPGAGFTVVRRPG